MTKKKKKLKLKIDFTTCLVIVLALVIVFYGCFFYKSDNEKVEPIVKEVVEKTEIENKVEEDKKIDTDSELVKGLYNKVTGVDGDYKYWMYSDYTSEFNPEAELNISAAKEIVKLNFVGKNIDVSRAEVLTCDRKIPDIINNTRSVCSANKRARSNLQQIGYKKEYVMELYKDIFGEDMTPDATIPLYLAPNSPEVYYYVDAISMYVKYFGVLNNVPVANYSGKISKVVEKDNKLKLYEEATNSTNSKIIFSYTFNKLDDNKYGFLGRKKEG